MGCIYCDKESAARDAAMIRITDLKSGALYLHRDQARPGHCVLALKEHIASLGECTEQQKADVSADLGLMTGLIREIAGAKCIAVSAATNRDTPEHLHYHIIPRYIGEDDPLDGDEPEVCCPSDQELQEMLKLFRVLINSREESTR